MEVASFFFIIVLVVLFAIIYYLTRKKEISPPELWKPHLGYKLQTEYGIKSETQNGTLVKSDVERRMANYFTQHNIRYEYEPLLWGGRYGNRAMHPDFYLPDHNVYVEYWGLVNAEDEVKKNQYVDHMKWKMAQYYSQSVKFISIYPHDLDTFNYTFPRKFEKVTGKKFPN